MKKLEVGIVILLLLVAEPLSLPRFVENIVSIISYAFLFFVFIRQWKKSIYFATTDISLLLFVTFAVASVFWSANPSNTAYQARLMLRVTLLGVYLGMQYTPREQIRLLCWTSGISMILSVATSLLFPSHGTQFINGSVAWTGIYTHKQILGRQMGFAASLFMINIFDRRSNRWIAIIGLSLAFAILLFSKSKTGLILLIFSLAILPIYKIIKQRSDRLLFLLIILFIATIFAFLVIVNFEFIVVDFLGKDIELNGRLPIWELAIEKGYEQPWLGYGYRGFWTSEASDSILYNSWAALLEEFATREIAFHAHNGLIDMFLELGLIGLFLFLLNFFYMTQRIIILLLSSRAIEYLWMLSFIGICFITNITESQIILSSTNTFWIVYVSVAISSAFDFRQMKNNLYLKTSL